MTCYPKSCPIDRVPDLPAATLCAYRLHALVRMVEVVLTNLQRIDQLWPIFLSHIIQLLGHPKTSIRNAATDALGKAVVGALSHVNALKDASAGTKVACLHKCLHKYRPSPCVLPCCKT